MFFLFLSSQWKFEQDIHATSTCFISKHWGAQKIADCLLPCATPEDAMIVLQRDLVEDLLNASPNAVPEIPPWHGGRRLWQLYEVQD